MSKIGDPVRSLPASTTTTAELEQDNSAKNAPVQDQASSTRTATTAETQAKKSEVGLYGSVKKQELSAACSRQLKTDAEVRQLYAKIFPALKEGVAKAGLDVNGNSCNVAAGMLKNALDKQGIEGATIKEGPLHAYVEVKTKEGGTLILDPTASQFFKDGSPIDQKLQADGFIGTKQELKQMLSDNIEHFNFPTSYQFPEKKILDAFRGKQVEGISREDANQALSAFLDVADFTYFGPAKGTMGDGARKQAEWRDNGNFDTPFIDPFAGDISARLKRGYEAMEQRLNEK